MNNKKKNCLIIHGCPSNMEKAMKPETRTYNKHWIPWVKEKLIEQGIKTETPLMPRPWMPDYSAFKTEFEKYHVSKNTILIGHSCGCAFLRMESSVRGIRNDFLFCHRRPLQQKTNRVVVMAHRRRRAPSAVCW